MKLTDRKIRNLKPKSERYEVWEGNGFGIRIATSGRKSWVFIYRFNRKPRRMTLGLYPTMSVAKAHAAHGKALVDLSYNIDPGKVLVQENYEHRNASTINELVNEYIEKWAKPRKRSWKEDKRILEKDVSPIWGKLKVKEITRRDVIKLLDKIVDRGAPISANRTFEIVRKMFNFAVERDIIEISPCLRIRAPGKKNQRDRVLTDEELQLFWNNLDKAKMDDGTRLAIRLQLVTAQRRGEVVSAEWSEINLKSGWWTIPAEKSKNNLAHRVPLSQLAIDLFKQTKEIAGNSIFIFPSPYKNNHIVVEAVTRAIGRNRDKLGIDHFTPHDLRRTAASQMTSIGIPRLVVSKILNHVDSGITAVYDRHSYDKEKRQALNAWAIRLEQIISANISSNVVSLIV